jgi:rhodanese-related sulfurtransferase|uniref:Rhodanese-related sulfurtransferase n=1 Tax=Fadolivirus 2 TaxID=2740747 RepID=A0A7D3QVG4_9VIRU|nr:rhodanese-related sulfurtransferase [Fadolivirus 2]
MNKIKTILIDIREEFELLEKQIMATTSTVLVLNIPMRAIFANKTWIDQISKSTPVYIICRSGNRSKKVKDKYFKKNDNVISVDGGVKEIHKNKQFKDMVKIVNGQGGFGLQQFMQLVFICMLLIIMTLMYFNVDKMYTMTLVLSFILFIIYQLYMQSCLISSILPLSDFKKK